MLISLINLFLSIFAAVLTKLHKTTKLFEFVLDILSEPRYSSIISWEGTDGQFAIKRPGQVACLWGERNGRPNMTYQKFSRALRYYYHKKVLTKIRGRNCVYKFDFRELEKQYGYHSNIPSQTTSQPIAGNGTDHYEILATCGHFQNPNSEHHFPASTELIDDGSYVIPAANPAMRGYTQHPHTTNSSLGGALYSVITPVMVQGLVHSPSCQNSHYFPYY